MTSMSGGEILWKTVHLANRGTSPDTLGILFLYLLEYADWFSRLSLPLHFPSTLHIQ